NLRDAKESGCTPELLAQLEQAFDANDLVFSRSWPEWIDPEASHDTPEANRADRADLFVARFVRENQGRRAALAPEPPASSKPAQSARPRLETDEDALGLERFVEQFDVRPIETVRVFATTGTATVRALRQSLERISARHRDERFSVQILLSSAYISDAGRAA